MAQSPADAGAGAVSRGREDASLYGGDKEFRLYQTAPDSGKDVAAVATGVFYKALAKDCAARQVKKAVWLRRACMCLGSRAPASCVYAFKLCVVHLKPGVAYA